MIQKIFQVARSGHRLFIVALIVGMFSASPIQVSLFSPPSVAFAQAPESPYSFATGKRMNTQVEETLVGEATSDLLTPLRGPKGVRLAVACGVIAAITYFVGLKVLGLSLTALGLGILAIPHPFIAMFLTILLVVIHRYTTRDDDRYTFRPKKEDSSKDSGSSESSSVQPLNPPTRTSSEGGSSPKINRPL